MFPFTHFDDTFTECTTVENNNIPWCSTKVDQSGNHIIGNWGDCADSCVNDDSVTYRESAVVEYCPDGWKYFIDTHSCFKVISSSKSWDDARASCQEFNADLASIHNEATNDFLSTLTSDLCWIGGFLYSSNNWKWVDGKAMSYTNWYPGQPDGSTNTVTFNQIWTSDGASKWDDAFTANSFICELKLKDNSTATSNQTASGKKYTWLEQRRSSFPKLILLKNSSFAINNSTTVAEIEKF